LVLLSYTRRDILGADIPSVSLLDEMYMFKNPLLLKDSYRLHHQKWFCLLLLHCLKKRSSQ
jgi:hypothetical protein